MTNEHPSMLTWQADTHVTWAVLGEIIAALGMEERIDWRRVQDTALKTFGSIPEAMSDGDMRNFIRATVHGVRQAVVIAKQGGLL